MFAFKGEHFFVDHGLKGKNREQLNVSRGLVDDRLPLGTGGSYNGMRH